MKIYDIAIIGGGPGGLYAHHYAKKNKLSSILIEANSELGGQPTILFPIKAIHDYPGWESIQANELMNDFIKKANHPDILQKTTVLKIEKNVNGFKLITSSNPVFAKYVIIATGGGFFKFNKIDGVESDCIHYCVKDINIYKNKKVIIAGGGDSALDWAAEIMKRNLTNDLSIVHRRNEFRAQQTKVDFLKQFKCNYYLNKTSKVIEPNKLEIIDKETNKKEILSFDYLIVQYGQSYSLQDNELLKPFKLDEQNRIIVDKFCQTNIENIYAIGNVASFENKPKLIYIAVSDAKKAIDHILNHE